tara:strand:- start:245 stop:1711 length:1467 start_codon:yes stop_codon:yes gene_type:complete
MLLINFIYSSINDYIGVNNKLVAYNKHDLTYFKKITTTFDNSVVIMGYNTWISIPNTKKPLINRLNIIISKNNYNRITETETIKKFSSISDSFHWLSDNKYVNIYVIGGSQLFSEIVKLFPDNINLVYKTNYIYNNNLPICDKYISYIHDFSNYTLLSTNKQSSATNIFSELIQNISCTGTTEEYKYSNQEIEYEYLVYQNNLHYNKNEYAYLDTMRNILDKSKRNTRNGDVYSDFGIKMEFNLLDGFPLLTTKKMPWKTVLRELLWFISGSTNNKYLQDKNVHIWDKNASKESLLSRGLKYDEGDLGPIYGFQWRHFGAKYDNTYSDYNQQGFDQLNYVINEIKTNPTSRRIIINSWNPFDIDKMALPPCHILFQLYIDNGFIDGQLYQRSGDMFLGVPFNIASYSFLLYIIGNITGYKPRNLIHIIGDAHIYECHNNSVEKQLQRIPFKAPSITINDIYDIDSINEEDIKIVDYRSYNSIKAEMIV